MNNAVDLKTLADEEIGDAHLMTSVETPMRKDAFDLSDEEKKEKIAAHFTEIMNTLGLDLNDDSLKFCISSPSIKIFPLVTSKNRNNKSTNVVLPAPLIPTIATTSDFLTERLINSLHFDIKIASFIVIFNPYGD